MCNYKTFVAFVFLLVTRIGFSQDDSKEEKCQEIENKAALKNYEKGIDKKKYQKEERLQYLKKAIEEQDDYAEANYALAMEMIKTLTSERQPYKPVEKYFLKVIETCPKMHSNPYYYLGFSYYEQENYKEAVKYLDMFLKFSDEDDKKFDKNYEAFRSQALQMKKYAKFYDEILNNPVPFDPEVVAGISTQKDEFLPAITADMELMYFTRRVSFDSKDQTFERDKQRDLFSISKKKGGVFEKGGQVPPPFNVNPNEGGPTLSIDNRHLYYTICKDEGGAQLNCDIYYSDFINGDWSDIQNLGQHINDPVYWDSQPSIAADGKTLYFSSDRPGGYGGADIYKTVRDNTGVWGKAINLGPIVNTSGHEKTPFIHSDSETLYFSSDGHAGVGGMDIFYIRKDEKGNWIEPKNIGVPINTEGDDLGLIVSTDGSKAFFATNERSKVNGKGVGGYDIYSFELYKEARPQSVAFFSGLLQDERGNVVKGAEVEIKNSVTKEKIDAVVDSSSGRYAAIVNLKKKDDIIITVKKEGFAFNSQIVSVKEHEFKENEKPAKVDFKIEQIVPDKAYTLNNIYYETGSSTLKKESMIVLEEFAQYLINNGSITVEIHGHTDNVGNEKDNQALSYERACNVRATLEDFGVSGKRLGKCQGYGSTKPVAPNSTEEGRAKNRRTEFVIKSK